MEGKVWGGEKGDGEDMWEGFRERRGATFGEEPELGRGGVAGGRGKDWGIGPEGQGRSKEGVKIGNGWKKGVEVSVAEVWIRAHGQGQP